MRGGGSEGASGELWGECEYDVSLDGVGFDGELFGIDIGQRWLGRGRFMFDILKFYLLVGLFEIEVGGHVFVEYFSANDI